jgi:hypothetical protein
MERNEEIRMKGTGLMSRKSSVLNIAIRKRVEMCYIILAIDRFVK